MLNKTNLYFTESVNLPDIVKILNVYNIKIKVQPDCTLFKESTNPDFKIMEIFATKDQLNEIINYNKLEYIYVDIQ